MASQDGRDDQTSSSTDIAMSSSLPEYEKLLGPRALRRGAGSEAVALLKFHHQKLKPELLSLLGVSKSPIFGVREMFVVLGPVPFEKIKAVLTEGHLKMSDVMIKGFDRWKSCKVYFPDLEIGGFESKEDTFTQTDTASASGMSFEETQTESQNFDSQGLVPQNPSIDLKMAQRLEEIEGEVLEVEKVPDPLESKAAQSAGPDPFEAIHKKEIFGESSAAQAATGGRGAVESKTLPPRKLAQPRRSELKAIPPIRASTRGDRVSRQSYLIVALMGAVVAGAYIYLNVKAPSAVVAPVSVPADSSVGDLARPQQGTPVSSSITEDDARWPNDLRPIAVDRLYENGEASDRIVSNIRRILNDYRKNGARIFAKNDEEYLLRQSQPGAASPEGQVLALNSLAVHYLNQRNPNAAYQKLKQFVDDESALDLVSLVNLGVSMYESGAAYDQAKPYLASALRQAADLPKIPIFYPTSLQAFYKIKGFADPRYNEIDSEFMAIEQKSGSNPHFYGMWIRALQKLKMPPKERIQQLLVKALWSDPDRIFDSSFENIPLARQWFIGEAFEGLRLAASQSECKLSRGQKEFLNLMMATRSSPSELPKMVAPEVKELLDRERIKQPLSALLFAYLLKEESKFSEAAAALSLMIQDPSENDMLSESSYAYSFAGELAMYSGKFDDAKLYFEKALKNPYEVSALWGVTLLAREAGLTVGVKAIAESEAKLAETLSADRSFLPALLRRERLTWHQKAGMR